MRIVSTIVMLFGLAGVCAAQQPSAPSNGSSPVAKTSSKTPVKRAKKVKANAKSAEATPAAPTPPDEQNPVPKEKLYPRKLPPSSDWLAEAGWAEWNLRGNESKFRQYGTLPSGFFLRDFRFAPEFKTPSQSAYFEVKDAGQSDYRVDSRAAWNYGNTLASGFLSESVFFDPSAGAVAPSTRQVNGAAIREFVSRDFSVSARFRDDIQDKNFATPDLPLNQDTQNIDITAGGKLGRGYGAMTYSVLDYKDFTGTLVDTTTQSMDYRYLVPITSVADAEANFNHVTISQPQEATAHVDTFALNSDINIGPRTDMELMFQNRQVGSPAVQDAYVRQQGITSVRVHQQWNGWRAQFGYKYQQDQYVNGDQTYVYTPHWNTFDGSITGKLSPEFKLTVRGSSRQLVGTPPSVLDNPESLYWDNRVFEQARLEGTWARFNAYAIYTFQDLTNVQRTSEIATRQVSLGGVWQISPLLNLFAEYDHEEWGGHTNADSVDLSLQDFLPDSDTGVIELTWNLHSRVFLSLSYTGFASSTANPLLLQDGNTSGNYVTITSRYRFPAGYELGLIVAPWTYHDNVVSSMDYSAAIVMVTGSARY